MESKNGMGLQFSKDYPVDRQADNNLTGQDRLLYIKSMRRPAPRSITPMVLAAYKTAASTRVAPDESHKPQHDLLGRYKLKPDYFPAANELGVIHIKAREFMIKGNAYKPLTFGQPFTSHDIAKCLVQIGPYFGLIMTHETKPNIFIGVDQRGFITATSVMAMHNAVAAGEANKIAPKSTL